MGDLGWYLLDFNEIIGPLNYTYYRYSWNGDISYYCSNVGFLTDEDSSLSHQHRICIQITDRWNHATLYSIWNIKRQGMNDDSFEKEMYFNSCSCVGFYSFTFTKSHSWINHPPLLFMPKLVFFFIFCGYLQSLSNSLFR